MCKWFDRDLHINVICEVYRLIHGEEMEIVGSAIHYFVQSRLAFLLARQVSHLNKCRLFPLSVRHIIIPSFEWVTGFNYIHL